MSFASCSAVSRPTSPIETPMTAAIIDGKAYAEALRARLAPALPAFVQAPGRKPGLAAVLVGEDPAGQVYVRSQGKAMVAEIGRAPGVTPVNNAPTLCPLSL